MAATSQKREEPSAAKLFATAPLVPVALLITLGLVLDRSASWSREFVLILIGIVLVGSLVLIRTHASRVLLAGFLVLVGGVYHHQHRDAIPADDISTHLTNQPTLLKVRGELLDLPWHRLPVRSVLQTIPQRPSDRVTIWVVEVLDRQGRWVPASGKLAVQVEHDQTSSAERGFAGITVADRIEIAGLAQLPRPPLNPGERDARERARDGQLRGDIRVQGTKSVVRIAAGDRSFRTILAQVRGWSTELLDHHLSAETAPTARALLLADTTAMDQREWESYIRTGVVHVLAISGQHLLVLAGFIWYSGRIFAIRPRTLAGIVMGFIVGYAILTGLRPSAVRAAVMVVCVCGALILRRAYSAENSFALAWIVVVVLNPTDPFSLGCQLSFLSVFVLIWGTRRWVYSTETQEPDDPSVLPKSIADRLESPLKQWIRSIIKSIVLFYAINLMIFAVNAPLILTEQNLISPVALLIGPILVLFSSIALIAGFMLLFFAWIPGIAELLGMTTGLALHLCQGVVYAAEAIPGGVRYLPGIPRIWLTVFYLFLAIMILIPGRFTRYSCVGIMIWLILILLGVAMPRGSDELRVTVLAVGHGNCTVLECPDGRVLLVDVGTLAGPDATRRVIAPYLWSRGIRRIDEVFLSHADADHFNNVSELLKRFDVGSVALTPSFSAKPSDDIRLTLAAIVSRKIPMRIMLRGDQLEVGTVTLTILHPTLDGPTGSENERSMVLLVQHAGQSILLPGDLEGAGTQQVVGLPILPVDVVVAPHHGSRGAWTEGFRTWARPKFVVVSRGSGLGVPIGAGAAGNGVPIWDTPSFGAVTLRSHASGLTAESFLQQERQVVSRGNGSR